MNFAIAIVFAIKFQWEATIIDADSGADNKKYI